MNAAAAGFALICFDGLNLLIDQRAVVSLENITKLRGVNDDMKTSEVMEGNACEVHSLTANLVVTNKVDARCHYIIVLQADEHRFGITVDSVMSLPIQDTKLHSLPACMNISESPIKAYIQNEDRIAFCCDVNTLWWHINSSENRHECRT
ncbi:MAG: chemotaxis protein CheW [Candidatus Nitrotoga sp.]